MNKKKNTNDLSNKLKNEPKNNYLIHNDILNKLIDR